ncbi:restriction endonuclease subunit S [Bacillus thuringiensis]|uniref:restriction endonuclease subunit S n=1 Tax=Bacillus thuringiensis TaxID=1428 RepID=UPI00285334AF|nr:restriction endonuclease subunit S [Bacillus thuringiensis]MDR4920285.1 restriction endonuclease subunit S [Bacillus thuringiensis]
MIPTLRFKGFKMPWVPTTLGIVSESLNYGLNAASTEYDGENKYIRITDIDDESQQYLEDGKVSPAGSMTDDYLVKQGDILLARTGASTGKSYLYCEEDGKMYFAGFLIRARIKPTVDYRFIYFQTLRNNYDRWVKVMSMRSGQPGINAKEYASLEFYLPENEEQQKIAEFLSLLDQKSKRQQEKVEQLKLFKKEMMRKIFSQEIRFKDENGEMFPEWKQKKMGELGSFFKGSNISKSDLSNEGHPCILYGELYTHYNSNIHNVQSRTNSAIANTFGQINDVLIPSSGETAIDIASASALFVNNVLLGGDINVFRPKGEISSAFISYQINSSQKRKLAKLAQGSSVVHLYSDSIKKLIIDLPCFREQQKISSFLSLLDIKIEKEQNKLKLLTLLKKGLIQKMFI